MRRFRQVERQVICEVLRKLIRLENVSDRFRGVGGGFGDLVFGLVECGFV